MYLVFRVCSSISKCVQAFRRMAANVLLYFSAKQVCEDGGPTAKLLELLKKGLELDTPSINDGATLLHLACRHECDKFTVAERCELVRAILSWEGGMALLDIADANGDTPLNVAKRGGHRLLVNLLCEATDAESVTATVQAVSGGTAYAHRVITDCILPLAGRHAA